MIKNMDGWMDKKIRNNRWMVDGQNNKNGGWMDRKIYEKIWMVGWIKNG